MAARHCPDCDLIFPPDVEYRSCVVCKERTTWEHAKTAPADWEARAQKLLEAILPEADENRDIIVWRVNALIKLGVPWELATSVASKRDYLSGGFELDVHEVESLVGRGCKPITAVRIAC